MGIERVGASAKRQHEEPSQVKIKWGGVWVLDAHSSVRLRRIRRGGVGLEGIKRKAKGHATTRPDRNVLPDQAADLPALDVAHGVPPPRAASPLLR
eukprot:767050-Hanusia_phi.AAC.3